MNADLNIELSDHFYNIDTIKFDYLGFKTLSIFPATMNFPQSFYIVADFYKQGQTASSLLTIKGGF